MRKAFDHIGIPTREPQPGESWVEHSKCWVTNPRAHPQRIEYIRAKDLPQVDPANVGLWRLWHWPHVAYRVDDCAAALERVKASGARVVDEAPRPGSRGTTVAFVHPNGAFGTLVELVQEPS